MVLDTFSKTDFVGQRCAACTMQHDGMQFAPVSSGGSCGIFFLDGRSRDGARTGMKEFLAHVRHLVSEMSEKHPRSMSVFVLYVPAFWDQRRFITEMTQMYTDNFWLTHKLDLVSAPLVLLYKLYVGAPEQKTVGLSCTTCPISCKTSSPFARWQKSPEAQVRLLGFRGGHTGLLLLWNGVPPRGSDLDGQEAELTRWCESVVKDIAFCGEEVRNLAFLCCLNGRKHSVCYGETGQEGQRAPAIFRMDSGAPFPTVRGVMVFPALLERSPTPERDRLAACLDFRKGVQAVPRAARPQTHSEWLFARFKSAWRLDFVQSIEELTTPKVPHFVRMFEDRVFALPGMSRKLACLCIVSFPVRMVSADDRRERCFASVEEFVVWLEAQPNVRVQWPWRKEARGMNCLASPQVLQEAANEVPSLFDHRGRGWLESLPLRTPGAAARESELVTTSPSASEAAPCPSENAMDCVRKANAAAAQAKSDRKKLAKETQCERREGILTRLHERQQRMGFDQTSSTQLWPRT